MSDFTGQRCDTCGTLGQSSSSMSLAPGWYQVIHAQPSPGIPSIPSLREFHYCSVKCLAQALHEPYLQTVPVPWWRRILGA